VIAGFSVGSKTTPPRWLSAAVETYGRLAAPLGLLLALLPHPIYDFYKDAPQLWGLSDIVDQQIAGLTMAVEQAIVFFAVFAYFFMRFLRTEHIAGVFSESSR